jgi:hypothetical protein
MRNGLKENYAMLRPRETCYFGKDRAIPGIRRRRDWKMILALAITLLIVIGFQEAWISGIIASIFHTFKLVVVAIWNMLADVFAACRDFL